MNRLFYLIIPLLIIAASWFIFDLSRYLPPDLIFHKGIKYESKDVQNRLVRELKKQDIPHRIRNDGFIEYRTKDDKKVKEFADKMHLEDSGNSVISPEIHKMLDKSRELIIANRYDEALDLLNRGISENNSVSILYNFRALIWSFKGEDDKAIVDYTSAIDLAPKYHEAYSNRARAWARKGEFQKAIEDYNRVLNIYSQDSSAIFYRGFAYSKLGDYERAFSDYKKVVKLDPKWAEESFNRDIPADPVYLASLAEHFAELGKFEKAIIIQERAIDLLRQRGDEDGIAKHERCLVCYQNRKLCLD